MMRSALRDVCTAVILLAGPMTVVADGAGGWCQTHERWAARNPMAASGSCPLQGSCDVAEIRNAWIPDGSTPIQVLRLHFIVFAEDDGSNPAATQLEVDAQLQQLNIDVLPSRFQFVATSEFVSDTRFRYLVLDEEFEMKRTYAVAPQAQLNVYVVWTGGVSFGTFAWDPNSVTFMGGIVMHEGSFGPGRSILTHEAGHNLGLWHTHHGVSEVGFCTPCYERADGLEGDMTGDYASDTPPTPRNFECEPPGGDDSCSETPWGDTDFENFMGYAPASCYTHFTPQQRGRLHCWFDAMLTGWLCDECMETGACCDESAPGVFLCSDVLGSDCEGTFFGHGTRCDEVGPDADRCDCNGNGTVDVQDIEGGGSDDCNSNNVPDECEPDGDCNGNKVADICDIADGTELDCNGNGIPDLCDIDDSTSSDCNANDIPDECEPDCNLNGIADACDITDGDSSDLDGNGVPDECQRIIRVAASAAGADDGTSWEDAYRDLQDALADAERGDQIHVAQGVYRPAAVALPTATFRLADGVSIYGGYAGPGAASPNERHPDMYVSVLSGDLTDNDGPDFAGNLDNSYNVVSSVGNDARTVLDGFLVTGGNGDGFTLPYDAGGGLRIEGGNPTIVNCTFALNSAVFGGGVEVFDGGDATFTDCTFRDNRATFRGGGMHSNGSSPVLIGCDFVGNQAENSGGGMRNTRSFPRITRCRFMGNTAGFGGGMVNDESDPELLSCLFAANAAAGSSGGMHNWDARPVLNNCTFAYNTADTAGGGILSLNTSLVSATSCVFWHNGDQDGTGTTSQITTAGSALDPVVNYCCIQGGWSESGIGNIAEEPLFIDADGKDNTVGTADDDFRLYRASPCIDAGTPQAETVVGDLDGHERILCGRIDMGPYEFGIGDYGCDGYVDLSDFADWTLCDTGPEGGPVGGGCEAFDFDADDDVDMRDFGGFQDAYVGDCAIEITQQPFGMTVCEGQAAQLAVSAVGPQGETLSYQWRRDGLDVVGATDNTLNIPAAIQSDNGSYRCIITAECAEIESSAAVDLVVNAPPTEFLSHPIGGTQCIGSTIFLIANASSSPTYQWFKDGESIEGATSPFLAIPNVVTEDSGTYHAEATNTCNTATSNDAVVEIIACPALGKQ